MKHIVKAAEMKMSAHPGDQLVIHGLGSCLGISVYDPRRTIGGLAHILLPLSRANPQKAAVNPFMFVDTGVAELFRRLLFAGCDRRDLIVRAAGGASCGPCQDLPFSTGKRNYQVFRKVLWRNNILIDAEDVGGSLPRTMHLEIGTGQVWITINGTKRDLRGRKSFHLQQGQTCVRS